MVWSGLTLLEEWVPNVSGIVVSVIFSDLHLMQLQIRAANGAFAAEVDTYVSHDAFATVATRLKGFPVSPDETRRIEIVPKISLTISTVDSLGHSIITVDMACDVPEQNNVTPRAIFNILANPGQIDQFAAELSHLKPEIGASASLVGT